MTGPKQAGGAAVEEEVDGLRFHRTLPRRGPLGSWVGVRELALMNDVAARLGELARGFRPDVLHAHSPVLNAFPALRVGRRLAIPVVYEVRALWEDAAVEHGSSRRGGVRYRATRALETHALRGADGITTICEGLRTEITARGVAPETITVIPNGVDVDRFSFGNGADPALQRSLGIEGARVLGFIGSFYSYEGLPVLLRAFPRILSRATDVWLLLAGGGPDESRIRGLASELGVSDRVLFLGRLPHEEIGRYYDLIDVLVYPRLKTRINDMVTPLKPLEAMARGRLLVASDVGGHRELIRDGETGVLFQAGDPESLAETVLALLGSPERWSGLRLASRRFVEAERSWPRLVARYDGVYDAARRRAHRS